MALAIGLVGACLKPAGARADEWGRYYHWPYSNFQQYYWTPYEYEQVYDYRYRYPAQLRVYPQVDKWRNWLYVKKPYYRGYHFVLDQF
jgi:hypothetical protein